MNNPEDRARSIAQARQTAKLMRLPKVPDEVNTKNPAQIQNEVVQEALRSKNRLERKRQRSESGKVDFSEILLSAGAFFERVPDGLKLFGSAFGILIFSFGVMWGWDQFPEQDSVTQSETQADFVNCMKVSPEPMDVAYPVCFERHPFD